MLEDSSFYFALCFVCTVVVGMKVITSNTSKAEREKFANIAAKKRKDRDSVNHQIFHKPKNVDLDNKIYAIHDAVELLSQFKTGQLSRADTILALSRRSCDIGRKELDSVTEEAYDEAYLEAKSLDEEVPEGCSSLPLLGVPVSIKDCIHMKGYDTTMGISKRCFQPQSEDGFLVQLLRRAGCIPFVRTNVPQLLLMPESDNVIWGVSKNPYNISRTSGGSSGGEASLIASRCSLLGLGSDIGGSIRIPAHYCGIVGFKPTPGRVSKKGAGVPRLNDRDGQIVIPATTGPMARSVRDCNIMMKALVNHKPEEDFLIPPLVWNDECALKGDKPRMRVAVMMTDGWFEPFPACKRAVQMASDALVAAGHEVVPFELPVPTVDVVKTFVSAMGADGNWYSLMRALEGEELNDSYKSLQMYTRIPNILRPLVKRALDMAGEHRKGILATSVKDGGLSVREYYEVISDVKAIRSAYAEAFLSKEYDGLLLPALAVTALPHGMSPDLLSALSYVWLANLLVWPAGTVPVTTTQADEAHYTAPEYEQDSMFRLAQKACVESVGLPVGVQVMTPQWQDEKCLFLMSEIEKTVNFTSQPSKYAC